MELWALFTVNLLLAWFIYPITGNCCTSRCIHLVRWPTFLLAL